MTPTKPTIALLDVDRLVYAVAFQVQGKDEPEANILNSAKLMLEALKREVKGLMPSIEKFQVILSDARNFRKMLDNMEKPYKGNRGPKPDACGIIRDYFRKYQKAWSSPYCEADDVCAMLHHKQHREGTYNTLLVDIDKDSLNTPGWHMSPSIKRKGFITKEAKVFFVESDDASYNFYKQLLTGDTVDNIPGVPGIGPKKADSILKGCRCANEMYAKVLDLYVEEYQELCYSEVIRVIIQRGNLLHMRRWPQDFWIPPAQHED